MKIDWNIYFDAVYCINFVKLQNRKKQLMLELDRIGLLSHQNFIWKETLNTKWHDIIFNLLKQHNLTSIRNTNYLSLAEGHYYCISHALEKKYNRILILEDDLRFLKDIKLIKKMLDSMPSNADLILFDKFPTFTTVDECNAYKETYAINQYYCKMIDNIEFLSAGCYMLSNVGIKEYYDLYNKFLLVSDLYHKIAKNINKYLAKSNLACLVTYSKCQNSEYGINAMHYRYKIDSLDYSQYMMTSDNTQYKYGSYIIESIK